jgi:hypothetical protein
VHASQGAGTMFDMRRLICAVLSGWNRRHHANRKPAAHVAGGSSTSVALASHCATARVAIIVQPEAARTGSKEGRSALGRGVVGGSFFLIVSFTVRCEQCPRR